MKPELNTEVTDFTHEPNAQITSDNVQKTTSEVTTENVESKELTAWLAAVKRYKTAQGSLASVAFLTIINIVLLAFGASLYFPFSATCPFLCTAFIKESEASKILYLIPLFMTVFYLLLRVLSDRSHRWMYVAFVFLIIDTLICIGWSCLDGFANNIIDLLFHVWILWSIFFGVKHGREVFRGPPQVESMQ